MATRSAEVSTPRGPYRKGLRRRAQIIKGASELFAEHGYAGTSIRAIAEKVGLSPASLLQYFGAKEALLAEVLEDWDRQTAASGRQFSGTGLDSFRRFPALMDYHIHNRGHLELFLTMAVEASSSSHPARPFMQRRYARNITDWTNQLMDAVHSGEARPMTRTQAENEIRLFTAVLDGVEIQWLLDPATDLVGLVQAYVDQCLARWGRPHNDPATTSAAAGGVAQGC